MFKVTFVHRVEHRIKAQIQDVAKKQEAEVKTRYEHNTAICEVVLPESHIQEEWKTTPGVIVEDAE